MPRALRKRFVKLMKRKRPESLQDQRNIEISKDGSSEQEDSRAVPNHGPTMRVGTKIEARSCPGKEVRMQTGKRGVTPSRSTCRSSPTDKALSRMRECRLVIGLDGVFTLTCYL